MNFQIDECRVPAVALDLAPVADAAPISLQLVDATADHAATAEFFRNKADCYRRFGSEAAAAVHVPSSGLHLVIARDGSGTQAGGVAVYIRSAVAPLPLEVAVGHEPEVVAETARWISETRVVELSSLWLAPQRRKSGLSRALMLTAMAAAHRIGASRVVGFSHQHVVNFYATVGLVRDAQSPEFFYPHAPYVSALVWGDPIRFSTVPVAAMRELRQYLVQLDAEGCAVWAP